MTNADRERGIQIPRNAWINAMRAEVLRTDSIELARVIGVGIWIATYADADGGNAFPGRDTLATLAGCAKETVTRAVSVMVAAGVLERKRRPNNSAMFQLLIPTERPDWKAHLPLYTETRQKAARRRKESEERAEEAERKASQNASRKAFPTGLPESVPERLPDESESVPGRPRKAFPDASRKAFPTVAYQDTPTSGRDPDRDQETAEQSPQPQVDGAAPPQQDPSPRPSDKPGFAATRCTACGDHMVHRPGRPDIHAHCANAQSGAA